MNFYAMDDTGTNRGVVLIQPEERQGYNDRNYGIFWSVNSFKDGVRRKENLSRINAWAIDMDSDSKDQQLERLNKSPLNPSMLIETKRGHQAYWIAKDASVENLNAIVEGRLIPFFKADAKAKDSCRILRVPGYYHCKNPTEKFMVKGHYARFYAEYSEREMLTLFKEFKDERIKPSREQITVKGEGFWNKVSNISPMQGLAALSGTQYVASEVFDFSRNSNGTHQIVVNGKPTSSWIDADNKIGSYEKGGPTIAQWLKWYGHSWAKIAAICKEVFKLEDDHVGRHFKSSAESQKQENNLSLSCQSVG